jgi:hypothetical protein
MKKSILMLLLSTASISSYGQTINLGTSANFALFTTTGSIGNTGISNVTGNIGTTVGAISTFSNIDGTNHSGDAISFLASTDLLAAKLLLIIN